MQSCSPDSLNLLLPQGPHIKYAVACRLSDYVSLDVGQRRPRVIVTSYTKYPCEPWTFPTDYTTCKTGSARNIAVGFPIRVECRTSDVLQICDTFHRRIEDGL